MKFDFETCVLLTFPRSLCAVLCLLAQLFLTLCNTMDWSPLGSSVHRVSPGKNTGVGCRTLSRVSNQPRDLPNPGIKPRSPALQTDALPSEPPGKPKITGVGSLSLLQGIFPIQVSNQGILNCRQILYQLSYQRNPPRSLVGVKS